MNFHNFCCLVLLSSVHIATANDDNCKWIYRCCEEVDAECIEMCEPQIICEATTEPVPASFAVFQSNCNGGYQKVGNSCRKVF